jgi:serine/threonine protein kinase
MEIEQDNNIRYKKMEKIGEGTYGSVVLVFDHQLNKTIAVKKIKMTQ